MYNTTHWTIAPSVHVEAEPSLVERGARAVACRGVIDDVSARRVGSSLGPQTHLGSGVVAARGH